MNISKNYQNTNSVNFGSKINLVDTNKFWDVMSQAYKSKVQISRVETPWTPREIVKAPFAFTEEVRTCTAGGIVTKNLDGSKDVVMFHFNPIEADCKNIDQIKNVMIEKIGNSKPIQALIVGSKDTDGKYGYSGEYFDKIENVLKQFKLPITKLKGIPMNGYETNVFYNAHGDTWTILNTKRDDISRRNPERIGFTGFKEVLVSALDKIIYD